MAETKRASGPRPNEPRTVGFWQVQGASNSDFSSPHSSRLFSSLRVLQNTAQPTHNSAKHYARAAATRFRTQSGLEVLDLGRFAARPSCAVTQRRRLSNNFVFPKGVALLELPALPRPMCLLGVARGLSASGIQHEPILFLIVFFKVCFLECEMVPSVPRARPMTPTVRLLVVWHVGLVCVSA